MCHTNYYPRPRYSNQDKLNFWVLLGEYKAALRTGQNFVQASLAIHAAEAYVPKSYHRYVTAAFTAKGL